jgi:hypothetical protein
MRTGLWMPISNEALGVAFLIALVFVAISGIWALLKHLSFRERETITFSSHSDQTAVASGASVSAQPDRVRELQEVVSHLVLPSEQSAIAFFSQLAPRAGLDAEINRTKNTMIFCNSSSTEHRLVIAITGSGRYATAYYSTQINSLTAASRLTMKIDGRNFTLKSSPESLIFRDGSAGFYEIPTAAVDAIVTPGTATLSISANSFSSEIGGQSKNEISAMAQLISRIARERTDIIFLGD